MVRDCGAWINLMSHTVKKRLNAGLANLGVTGVQSQVMHFIMARCSKGPVFQRDVEDAFDLSRSTAAGILNQLERRGLIRREGVAEDGRLKSLIPTQQAVALQEEVHACIQEIETEMTKNISPEERQQILDILSKMYQNLSE